ncbi:MAG: hypothetical protein WKF92_07470 [Pyrinomonadaceae bacterium]
MSLLSLVQNIFGGKEEVLSPEYKYIEYSAIIDEETCPACRAADGMRTQKPSELPPAPNPQCTSSDMCRCFHVKIGKNERD